MAFDVSKYQVSGTEVKILEVEGEEIEIKIRPVPWNLKNQFLADSMSWDANGNTRMDMSGYNNKCLKYIIVEAPWGETTDTFLISLGDNEFTQALSMLVPRAFGQGQEEQPKKVT